MAKAKKPAERAGPGKGGARPGSGRKRLYGKSLTTTVAAAIPEPLLAKLDRWRTAEEMNRSQAIVEAVKRLVS